MTSYIFRCDDACPTMNWEKWLQIENILDHYNIRPIVAVIPDNKDPELIVNDTNAANFWETARNWDRKNWVIAVHGFNHVYDNNCSGIMGLNSFSEFAGHPYNIQFERVKSAVEIFKRENLDPFLWVAPAHSFDRVTLQVLMDCGIRTISDGFSFRAATDSSGICWIPQQLWNLRSMPFGLWTFCCHPNLVTREYLGGLKKFLDKNHHHFIKDLRPILAGAPVMCYLDKIFHNLVWFIHYSHAIGCKALMCSKLTKKQQDL